MLIFCLTKTTMGMLLLLVFSLTKTTAGVLFLLVSTTINGDASASCLSSEASILLRIKQDLHLFNGRLSSWDANNISDCCMWEGVVCDPLTGHIIGLQLHATTTIKSTPHALKEIGDSEKRISVYNRLVKEGYVDPRDISGSRVPPALFELRQLQHLDLSGCNFNGSSIPLELAQLTHLTRLNLSRAWFSGFVPNEISCLSNLVSLDLSYISHFYFDVVVPYHWFDDIPFTNLVLGDLEGFVKDFKHLQSLHLDLVVIELNNPQEWSIKLSLALPNLRSLSLFNCRLHGSLSHHIFKLPHLQAIVLSYNLDLNGKLMPLFFPPDSNLQSLRLASTNLSGSIPFEIFELPLLKVLDMSNNVGLSGPLPTMLPKSNLQVLKLANLMLSGDLPGWIGNLTSLVELDLSLNNLSGHFPTMIGNLRCLTMLDLSHTRLSGSISSTIGNLTSLLHLDLSYTSLSGSIPSSIGNLIALTHLDLSYSSLSGSLPHTMQSLIALSYFDLSGCMFTGIHSSLLANLAQLTYLDLSDNIFTGPLPSLPYSLSSVHIQHNFFTGPVSNLFNLLNIEILDLSYNRLTGTIPSIISFIQFALRYLDLSNNMFNGHLDLGFFANFKHLYFLSLSKNNLIIDAHNPTLTFPSLQNLSLASCNIDQFPQFLCHHKPLDALDLSENLITGEVPKWLNVATFFNISDNKITSVEQGALVNISVVDLSSNMLNSISSSLFPTIRSFDNMLYISISNNGLTGQLPASLCSFFQLRVLDLSNNNLIGRIPDCLSNLTSLWQLKLQNNQLEGQIPEFSYNIRNRLRILDLSNNRLTGYIPTSLRHCKRLQFINLGFNKLSGAFPSWFEKLPELTVLVLRSNSLSGVINFTFKQNAFQGLRMLDISTDQFTGKLPVDLLLCLDAMKTSSPRAFCHPNDGWDVTMIIKGISLNYRSEMVSLINTIDFSNNNFDGEIPEEIGELTWLQALRISNNKLVGSIPKNIGGLQQLESLDLSHNYFSGDIPEELTKLNFLEYLNLSYNNLCGRIPQSPHFSTFDDQMFEENPCLCGPPVKLPCEANNDATLIPFLGMRQTNNERMWKCISIGLGFGAGFGTVISFSFLLNNGRGFDRIWRRY